MKKVTMLQSRPIADAILEAVRDNQGCQLDELAVSLPYVSWEQVFLEVGRLSRNGQVHVTLGAENCTVRLRPRETVQHGRFGK